MSMSEKIKFEKRVQIQAMRGYAIASAFCLVFYLIYDQFSHEVRSNYLTYLCLWPLLLGFLPSVLLQLVKRLPKPGIGVRNLYRCGVEALTVSSALRGIFDIAGNASSYQTYMMVLGGLLWAMGIVGYTLQIALASRLHGAEHGELQITRLDEM